MAIKLLTEKQYEEKWLENNYWGTGILLFILTKNSSQKKGRCPIPHYIQSVQLFTVQCQAIENYFNPADVKSCLFLSWTQSAVSL